MSAPPSPSRRELIKTGVSSLLGLGAALGSRDADAALRHGTLVFVLLRGGADGLSMIIPYTDPDYYRARPRTAIRPPGKGPGRALAVDARHALHPALAPLEPLYRERELALLIGTGLNGVRGRHAEARSQLEAALSTASRWPFERPAPTEPLSQQLAHVTQLLYRGDLAPPAFLLELDGFDTHAAQGAENGRLAHRLAELSRELLNFRRALEHRSVRARVVVLTEFGRSVTETPMGGTDDGGASVALVLGSSRWGGQVVGEWPALTSDTLVDRRFVPVARTLPNLLEELSVDTHGGGR